MSVRFRPPAPIISITYVYSPDPSYPRFSPDCDKIVTHANLKIWNLDSGLLFRPITKTWPWYVIVFAYLSQSNIRDPNLFCKTTDRLVPNLLIKLLTCQTGRLTFHNYGQPFPFKSANSMKPLIFYKFFLCEVYPITQRQRLDSEWWLNTILWVEIVFLSKKIQFLIIVLYLHRWSAESLPQKMSFPKRTRKVSPVNQGQLFYGGQVHLLER